MEVSVRLFALQRQQVGRREVRLVLADGATIAEAWDALAREHDVLAAARPFVRFARNGEYAAPEDRLTDGDELAVIPPVAGGSDDRPVRWIALSAEPIGDTTVAQLRAAVASTADGAVVTFLGRTRETPGTPAPGQAAEAERFAGQAVLELEYEAYEAMALQQLERIADEIEARFGVSRVAIVHRTGVVGLGENSVAIAVAAPHRGPAFDACRYAIEELKARAPIWKSEHFADGGVWLGAPAREGPEGAR
ncbi:MAG: molybdenum cofactor biosynthesis protein MoaE, partial [Candidatus Limnocylindrales bacterium]